MLKINFDKILKNLDGEEVLRAGPGTAPVTTGQLLGNCLAGDSLALPVEKAYTWAPILWSGKELQLDKTDAVALLAYIKALPKERMSPWEKGHIMPELTAMILKIGGA